MHHLLDLTRSRLRAFSKFLKTEALSASQPSVFHLHVQGGNAQSAAYSLKSLLDKTQEQIVLQAAGLAKQTQKAEEKNPNVRPPTL